MKLEVNQIAIIGLGYVGLPLAIEFAKKYKVLGFDIDQSRTEELELGIDRTLEANLVDLAKVIESKKLNHLNGLSFSNNIEDLKQSNVYIVTVPTPIDKYRAPDLKPLLNVSEMLGKILKKNDIVVYESTVFPGCTEDECVPILENFSGLEYNIDFFCGYSPERINPGDKVNTLTKIKKVTSGSNIEVADFVDNLYKSIITAGTFKAASIKVAEASKAIENAQRDLNISFVNELALIFDKIGIDTNDVLEAASTKWNFLKYKPGLVGGHCIGVDPYYLAHKAESVGYYPQVILSGRRVNDNMGLFISNKIVKLLISKGIVIANARAIILGFTFKENCPDIRNTKVIDIYKELNHFGVKVEIYDPHVSKDEVFIEYGIQILDQIVDQYEVIILAVGHDIFLDLNYDKIRATEKSIIYDVKSFLDRRIVDARL